MTVPKDVVGIFLALFVFGLFILRALLDFSRGAREITSADKKKRLNGYLRISFSLPLLIFCTLLLVVLGVAIMLR